jgi:ATP-dependent Clp protease ATP-binding subunit ClpA
MSYTQIVKKNLLQYYKDSIKNYGEGVINIFIFLPYFFSVPTLIKTFFYPWKNLQSKKVSVGFTFSEWGNRFAYNFISRSIGFFMRISIVSFYFIFQTAYMLILPFISMIFFVLIPIFYFFYTLKKSPDEIKMLMKKKFFTEHLIKEENRSKVEEWFEIFYKNNCEKADWWKLSNLLEYPPLARDWAAGFSPTLDQYTIDLASSSYLHHINNMVGRDKEIKEIEQVLSKNFEANVIIVGDEGVGKHTIIDALAKKIYLGKTNSHLIYRRILKLNMEKIKGDKNLFEELLNEALEANNIILFIDNIEKYLEMGISLEKYAKSDRLQLIGLTTPFFYQKFILPNDKINRLFNKVDVYEVSKEEALKILLEKTFDFENYHKVIIPFETLTEIIDKSDSYITYIPFPEKAVDLLDSACVYTKTGQFSKSNTLNVTPEIVDFVLTEKTHIPITITSQMKDKLLQLEKNLSEKVLDQKEPINKLSSSLRRSFLLIGKRKKPLASFLFLGPTGVGKTETAKAVASEFFSNSLIRFDMSNFQTKYDIPKLIGDSNHNEPGLLSIALREKPYGVLLLDEIEKADKDLINIFLTVVDEGYFTDGFGKNVDCKNLVIIATTNAVSESAFSPEFLNRFDGIITYSNLSESTIKNIAKKLIKDLTRDIQQLYNIKLKISTKMLEKLIEKGYDTKYGARNLERVLRDEVEDKVAKLVLEEKVKSGGIISI